MVMARIARGPGGIGKVLIDFKVTSTAVTKCQPRASFGGVDCDRAEQYTENESLAQRCQILQF